MKFLYVKKRFSHSIHVLAQSVSALFSSKTLSHFTYVEAHDASLLSFTSKTFHANTATSWSIFSFMVGNIMFVEFPFRQKTFSHLLRLIS